MGKETPDNYLLLFIFMLFYETGGVEPLLKFYINKEEQSYTTPGSRNIKGKEKIASITQNLLAIDLYEECYLFSFFISSMGTTSEQDMQHHHLIRKA
jgi:hypothetical protein